MEIRIDRPSDAALWLWDYFCVTRWPTDAEAKVWRRIECATVRIRESEPFLADKYPAPVRLANARRVRRATREIMRVSEQLESVPEPWVGAAIGLLEAVAELTIDAVRDAARDQPLH